MKKIEIDFLEKIKSNTEQDETKMNDYMNNELNNKGYKYLMTLLRKYHRREFNEDAYPTEEIYEQIWADTYDFIWDHAHLIMENGTESERAVIMNEAADCDKEWNGEEFIQN